MTSIGTACTDQSSYTNLHPDGPPAVAEVRMKETYQSSPTSTTFLSRRVFGFGSFPTATADQAHAVTSAAVTGQGFRVIMDKLLVGNAMEQIQCRAAIDGNGAFSNVPLGATPDDIALCSVNSDALKATCHGPHATCICALDAGCGTVAKGDPVGILDVNNDGAADNTSFIDGAVGLKCGTINVPIDLDQSYWYPSGDQQVPASGGFDALGPAIVLVPKLGVMPTNLSCGLSFASNVVDKNGAQVCTPPGGRPVDCGNDFEACNLACTPGDVSAFTFKTDALRITVLGITDMATGVSASAAIFANANAPIDPATLSKITFSPAAPVDMTITAPMSSQIKFTFTTPLTAGTKYTITFPTTLTDSFGQGLPAPTTITFTTA